MFSQLFNFLAPKQCIICKQYGSLFCEDCVKKIYRQEAYCYVCKSPSNHFFLHRECVGSHGIFLGISQILVFGHYNGSILKKVIHEAKFYRKRELLIILGNILSSFLQENIPDINPQEYVFIAPPMHFLRKWKRSYNHSEILSKTISQNLGIPDISFVLTKKKYTKQQSKLEKRERLKNLSGTYAFSPKYRPYIEGKSCTIVDDVISTGATISEISQVLLENGAKEVKVIVVASH